MAQLPGPLRFLCSLERFHLHDVAFFFGTSTFDPRYLPHNCGPFRLPCYWIHRKHFHVYGSQTNTGELKVIDGNAATNRILFPVHPVYLERFRDFLKATHARDNREDGPCIWAVPTASTRTLLAWPDQQPQRAVFFKTSLHDDLQGIRQLTRARVARSIGMSNLIQHSEASLPQSLDYFQEGAGFVPRRMPDCGVIVRSVPRELTNGSVVLAPLFSLMGTSGSRKPLFLSILESSGITLQELLEDLLCKQFAKLWLEMAMKFGLLIESHGQDLLLALSPQLRPSGRFFYRDFEGFGVDWELRRARGLSVASDMPCAGLWRETYTHSGLRYGDLISQRLKWSLHGYLHFVLNELESALIEWQRAGWLGGRKLQRGNLTMLFSRTVMTTLSELFGASSEARYDIYRFQNRFAGTLFTVRKRLLLSLNSPCNTQ